MCVCVSVCVSICVLTGLAELELKLAIDCLRLTEPAPFVPEQMVIVAIKLMWQRANEARTGQGEDGEAAVTDGKDGGRCSDRLTGNVVISGQDEPHQIPACKH